MFSITKEIGRHGGEVTGERVTFILRHFGVRGYSIFGDSKKARGADFFVALGSRVEDGLLTGRGNGGNGQEVQGGE